MELTTKYIHAFKCCLSSVINFVVCRIRNKADFHSDKRKTSVYSLLVKRCMERKLHCGQTNSSNAKNLTFTVFTPRQQARLWMTGHFSQERPPTVCFFKWPGRKCLSCCGTEKLRPSEEEQQRWCELWHHTARQGSVCWDSHDASRFLINTALTARWGCCYK